MSAEISQPQTMLTALAALEEDFGGPDIVVEVVDLYLSELPGRVGRIALGEGVDVDAAARGAHSLKSASALVGFPDLSALAGELEDALRQGAPVRPGLVEAVVTTANQSSQWLEEWRRG